MGTGLASPIVQSLLLTLNVTAVLSEKYEKIQVYLVESSHLVQNFFEMEEMKKTLSGDSVSYRMNFHRAHGQNCVLINWTNKLVITTNSIYQGCVPGLKHPQVLCDSTTSVFKKNPQYSGTSE